MRAFVLVLAALVAGCGPSFEDQLVGDWACRDAEMSETGDVFDFNVSYNRDNSVQGQVSFEFQDGPDRLTVKTSVDGDWSYNGEDLTQSLSTTFDELQVNGETIPDEMIPEEMSAGLTNSDSYQDKVELVEGNLIWTDPDDGVMVCTKK